MVISWQMRHVYVEIFGPGVAEFFLGKSLGAKMAISDVQIMAIIHREI
jgi:hypothetical protein